MPRDHISDFESVGGRVLCGGTGSDSGELYSRLNDGRQLRPVEMINGKTDVPVFPLLARGICNMSREVPKSESIARGLAGHRSSVTVPTEGESTHT